MLCAVQIHIEYILVHRNTCLHYANHLVGVSVGGLYQYGKWVYANRMPNSPVWKCREWRSFLLISICVNSDTTVIINMVFCIICGGCEKKDRFSMIEYRKHIRLNHVADFVVEPDVQNFDSWEGKSMLWPMLNRALLIISYLHFSILIYVDCHYWIMNDLRIGKSIQYTSNGNKHANSRTYYCHRSGHFKSRGTGVRANKSNGSNKIGGECPSQLVSHIYFMTKYFLEIQRNLSSSSNFWLKL